MYRSIVGIIGVVGIVGLVESSGDKWGLVVYSWMQ